MLFSQHKLQPNQPLVNPFPTSSSQHNYTKSCIISQTSRVSRTPLVHKPGIYTPAALTNALFARIHQSFFPTHFILTPHHSPENQYSSHYTITKGIQTHAPDNSKLALHNRQSSYIRLPFLRSLLLENIGLLLPGPLSNNLLPRSCSTERIRLQHKPQFLVALLPNPNIHHSNAIPPHANTTTNFVYPTQTLSCRVFLSIDALVSHPTSPSIGKKINLNFPFHVRGRSHINKAIIPPKPQFSHEHKTSHNTLSCPKLKSLHLLNHR